MLSALLAGMDNQIIKSFLTIIMKVDKIIVFINNILSFINTFQNSEVSVLSKVINNKGVIFFIIILFVTVAIIILINIICINQYYSNQSRSNETNIINEDIQSCNLIEKTINEEITVNQNQIEQSDSVDKNLILQIFSPIRIPSNIVEEVLLHQGPLSDSNEHENKVDVLLQDSFSHSNEERKIQGPFCHSNERTIHGPFSHEQQHCNKVVHGPFSHSNKQQSKIQVILGPFSHKTLN